MFRHILVPLDGSRFAETALPWAAYLARRTGARLELVTALPEIQPGYAEYVIGDAEQWHRERETDAHSYLAAVAERQEGVRAEMTVVQGPPADAIDFQARSAGVDLIAMATHGHGPISRTWLGSVADKLVRTAVARLLLVKPEKDEDEREADVEPEIRTILVPLDGSPTAEQALPAAVELARLLGAKCVLARAVPPLVQLGDIPMADAPDTGLEVLEVLRRDAEGYLEAVAAGLTRENQEIETTVLLGPPAHAILACAEELRAQLISMTTHGRTGIERVVLGSVADKVIRGAHVPVMVWRPPGARG